MRALFVIFSRVRALQSCHMNALVFSQSEARNFFMYIITREMASAPKLPDPPNPVCGPVPFEGVSPSVIDQSNWSSFPSFLHWQKPESKEHTPGEKNNRHFFQTFLLYLQKENLFPGGQISDCAPTVSRWLEISLFVSFWSAVYAGLKIFDFLSRRGRNIATE